VGQLKYNAPGNDLVTLINHFANQLGADGGGRSCLFGWNTMP